MIPAAPGLPNSRHHHQRSWLHPPKPAAGDISIRLQQRIRDLEETLRDERRALTEAEQRYAELDGKYQALAERVRT